jgi:hypothetical protein
MTDKLAWKQTRQAPHDFICKSPGGNYLLLVNQIVTSRIRATSVRNIRLYRIYLPIPCHGACSLN